LTAEAGLGAERFTGSSGSSTILYAGDTFAVRGRKLFCSGGTRRRVIYSSGKPEQPFGNRTGVHRDFQLEWTGRRWWGGGPIRVGIAEERAFYFWRRSNGKFCAWCGSPTAAEVKSRSRNTRQNYSEGAGKKKSFGTGWARRKKGKGEGERLIVIAVSMEGPGGAGARKKPIVHLTNRVRRTFEKGNQGEYYRQPICGEPGPWICRDAQMQAAYDWFRGVVKHVAGDGDKILFWHGARRGVPYFPPRGGGEPTGQDRLVFAGRESCWTCAGPECRG